MNLINQQELSIRVFKFVFPVLVLLVAYHASSAQTTIECGKEGERCAFTGTVEVNYGVGNKWAKKVVTSSIQCGVAGFGYDPAPNEHKTCVIPVTTCAREGGRCNFTGVRTVRYGRDNTWAAKTFKDGVTCGVAAFGYDPVPNVGKSCFLAPAAEKPINEITWLGTHNAIASSYYGISTQNSQRDGVTAQLERGARALEIDTVQDDLPGYGAGVFVCHCGAAPHSLSPTEAKRFATGKENQTSFPFALDGWTHPTPYMRFSTILKEIDKWMIANPSEIVFILMENNSSTGTELDTEIEAAGLKTGIYRHADDNAWATRAELVRSNKRLIFQVSDDKIYKLGYRGLAGESKYATPKYKVVDNTYVKLIQYGALTPPGYGNKNEYDRDMVKASRDQHQLLIMGAFNSAITDEITAGAYNKYLFLLGAKAGWIATDPINTFYPSIIQVNQIHIGDALRFVNDVNGTDYLISSKHDNIGDTSGDSWQVRFENNAAYNAGIVVTYWQDVGSGAAKISVPMVVNSGVVSLATGVARMVNIPRNLSPGKPITVKVMMYSTADFELYTENIPADFTGSPVPCFMASGQLAAPKGGKCG